MNLYGLIGNPLSHSFSPKFFNEKFLREKIDAEYVKFEIPDINLLPQIIGEHKNLAGLNVTIPYKQQVMQYLNDLDPQAKEIGAVNVIKIIRENGAVKLKGYNSDITGFENSISPLINKNIHNKALILGTGGASKAISRGLRNLGLEVIFVSRVNKHGQFTYSDLSKEIISDFKVIVNTSPVGTYPKIDEAPDIPYRYLSSDHLLYDLVYNPSETKFLKLGEEYGAVVKNGAEMLELQAIASWEIWNQ